MSFYSRTTTGALPDVEVFEEVQCAECGDIDPQPGLPCNHPELRSGWFWWVCLPGCLPDSDPHGPFLSAGEALEDAREDE